jgi:hypothetical protein
MSGGREQPCGTTGSHSEEDHVLARQTEYGVFMRGTDKAEGHPAAP